MFERFTTEARHIVVRSQEIARDRLTAHIGTEHLALALLEHSPNLWGILSDPDKAWAEVDASAPKGERSPSGHIPFTPNAKKSFELALRAALTLDHGFIAPQHQLLGMLRGDGLGRHALGAVGLVDNDDVKAHLAESLSEIDLPPARKPPTEVTIRIEKSIAHDLLKALLDATRGE